MVFNSPEFIVFLAVTFAAYWLSCRFLRLQNLLIVIASYVFYGWWDWRFLLLMAFTTTWSYLFGLFECNSVPRSASSKARLALSCVINLGILGFFKYCNFFIDSAAALLTALGFEAHYSTLRIILPVGISFYTFQALSYTIDVYHRDIEPTRDPIAFFAFISFFPQLVAGPIERATNLLPQFLRQRQFSYPLAVEGCRQMLWGFFKKVVVADSCAFAANSMLNNIELSSISLWIGMAFFAIQIYGDFSGYSDIAIGCSKLFGIRLMRNFAHPYFSRDIAEFWRRWHISLTTWFRDYLYIPLGGSRCGTWKKIRNTFAIFLVSGFWHGANWTFVFWGAFHALCFLPLILLGKNRKYISNVVAEGRILPTFPDVLRIFWTFVLVVIGWTFFRAPNIGTAFVWLKKMLTLSDLRLARCGIGFADIAIIPVILMIVIEWLNRSHDIPMVPHNRFLRWIVYYATLTMVLLWKSTPQTFIYFQF